MSRRSTIIAIAAAMVLAGLWFLLLWGPQGGRLTDAQEREAAADQVNSELELRIARLEAAQDSAPARMAELEGLRRAVPDDPELAQFILDANQAASEAGVDFLSISPSVPVAGTGGLPPVISLSISVTGGYFAVLDYLERLDGLPRIVVIDSIALNPGQGAGASGALQELSVAITGRMFATAAPQLVPDTTTVPTPGDGTTTTAAPQNVSSTDG